MTKFSIENLADSEQLEKQLMRISDAVPDEVLALLPDLAMHDTPGVREQVARLAGLGEHGSPSEFISLLLTLDQDDEVAETATYSLRSFLAVGSGAAVESRLLDLLSHGSLRVRISAILVLGLSPRAEAVVGPLIRRFLVSENDRERDAILETLVSLRSEEARSLFTWQVADSTGTHRVDPRAPSLGDRAAEGLAKLSSQRPDSPDFGV